MGVSGMLVLFGQASQELNYIKIIQQFLQSGWSLNDQGQITLLPVDHVDVSDWTHVALTEPEKAFSLLEQKYQKQETAGIVLIHEETKIGSSVILQPSLNYISFYLDINRKELGKSRFRATDYSFYLNYVLPILEATGYCITAIQCTDG